MWTNEAREAAAAARQASGALAQGHPKSAPVGLHPVSFAQANRAGYGPKEMRATSAGQRAALTVRYAMRQKGK